MSTMTALWKIEVTRKEREVHLDFEDGEEEIPADMLLAVEEIPVKSLLFARLLVLSFLYSIFMLGAPVSPIVEKFLVSVLLRRILPSYFKNPFIYRYTLLGTDGYRQDAVQ